MKDKIVEAWRRETRTVGRNPIIVENFGYDEINLNCGCPSPKVTKNYFGACLMKEPELVAKCINAMTSAVTIPVTIKCRLGVDDLDNY